MLCRDLTNMHIVRSHMRRNVPKPDIVDLAMSHMRSAKKTLMTFSSANSSSSNSSVADEGSSKLLKHLVFQRKPLVSDFCKITLSGATQPDKLLQPG